MTKLIAHVNDLRDAIQSHQDITSLTFTPEFELMMLYETDEDILDTVARVLTEHDPIKQLRFQNCTEKTNVVPFSPYFAKTTKLQSLTIDNVPSLPRAVTSEIFKNFGNSCSNLTLELFGEKGDNLFDISTIKNPASIKKLKLCLLDCSHNFVENCKKFVNLESLHFSDEYFNDSAVDSTDVISFFPHLKTIQYTLASPGKMDNFFKNLEIHPSISDVYLFHFGISPENGNSMKNMLKHNATLKKFAIWNWTSPEGIVDPLLDLISGIGLNHTLASITIDTYLTQTEIEKFGESLANKSNLTYLFLNSRLSVDPVLSSLSTLQNLKKLMITHARVSSTGVSNISDCLRRNHPLEYLKLAYILLPYQDASSMINSLKTNTNLRECYIYTDSFIGVFPACVQLFQVNITLIKFELRSYSREVSHVPQEIVQNLVKQNAGM
jgi:hypothetical protein